MTTIRTIAFDARYVSDRYHGIGRHAYNLLEALTRLDQNRRYLVYYHPGYRNTRFDMEVLKERSNVEMRSIQLPLYLPSEQLIWPVLLRKERVDLFHTPYVALPLLAGTKSIMTVHDLIFEMHPEYQSSSYLQKFYQPMAHMSIKRANIVFTVSEAAKRDIQAYYRIANIHVIGNAVDATFQQECDSVRLKAVRERYNLPEHFVMTIGAGRPHKNVKTLVESFAYLDPSIAPMLVIGGEPDPRFPDDVGVCIQAHNLESRVVRPGMIEETDLPVVYSLADVFVFPSLTEGFGLPPLEAMACGTPVLASTTPAVFEAVGDAALMFDPCDPEQLASVLNAVLTDSTLRATLSQIGRERVQAFTWERVARETLRAYASLEVKDKEATYTAKR